MRVGKERMDSGSRRPEWRHRVGGDDGGEWGLALEIPRGASEWEGGREGGMLESMLNDREHNKMDKANFGGPNGSQ